MLAKPVSAAPQDGSSVAIDPKEFRSAAGQFMTGVTIATTLAPDGQPRGVTVNSFTTVSLDPPLILFCVGRSSRSFDAFDAAQSFAVNILSSAQRQLSSTFGSKIEDKFADTGWTPGRGGSPLFPGSLSRFDCVLHQKIDAGDHIVLIGRVIGIDKTAGTPLGYYSGNYIDFDMQRETVDASAAQRSRFGGLFHYKGDLFFLEREGQLSLPFAASLGEENREGDSLLGLLDALGLKARLSFVYSVFSDDRSDVLSTVYLGEITEIGEPGHGGYAIIREEDIPFERVSKFQGMIRRYIRERQQDQFGLYVGTSAKGTIHRSR